MQRKRNSALGKRIGSRVRDLRTGKSWSQAQLADKLECHQPDISDLESGKHVPQTETLMKLASVFEVAISDLLAN